MGAVPRINCRFFGPLQYEKVQTKTDFHGNEAILKTHDAAVTILGKIEEFRRVQSGDSHDQVEYSDILFTNEVLRIGDLVEGREVVKIEGTGEYGLQ